MIYVCKRGDLCSDVLHCATYGFQMFSYYVCTLYIVLMSGPGYIQICVIYFVLQNVNITI